MKRSSMAVGMKALFLPLMATFCDLLVSAQPVDDSIAFTAAAPAPAVSARSTQKIAMVSNTLKDILQSVVNEEKQETAIFEKYTTWCKTENSNIAKDLSETKTELANAKVLSEEQTSNIDSFKLFIKKSEKETEDTNDAVAQAVSIRKEENTEYTEEMETNAQSLRQIEAAIKHVSKVATEGGFLQNGVMKKMQLNQPGESSYVFGVMKGLKDQLNKARAELKKVEDEKVKGHDSFMKTKGASLKALGDATTEKKISLTETVGKEESTKRKVGKLTEELTKLEGLASKTVEKCETTRQEWKLRQADRTKEKAALNEAIRYLTEISLEQVSLIQQRDEDKNDEEHASVVFAPSFVQDSSVSSLSNNDFYAAASAELMGEDDGVEGHMRKDTFNGVKTIVTKLISSHDDTQKEESSKKKYCTKEIATKEDEKADTTNALEAVKADIGKKTSEVETLTDEVKKMYASIDQIKKSLEDAGKVRKQELAVFTSGSKDRAIAIKVLNQAKNVLQDFYDKKKGNLLQGAAPAPAAAVGGPPPAKWEAISPRKTTASFGAVSMVQDIADDIAKEQKDAAMAERDAADSFTQLQQDSQKQTDEKQKDITDRVMAKAKLGVQINTLKETQTEKSDDLTAITKQLESLHKECDELLKNYDKRKEARTFEVSQLKDVMDILSGSSIAVRTGLMQESDVAGSGIADESSAADMTTQD